MKKRSAFFSLLFRSIFLILNLLVVAWLLLCKYASVHNPAGHPTFFSLFSLTTAIAFLANIFFVVYWLFTKTKIRSLGSLILIVLFWPMVRPLIGLNYLTRNDLKVEDGDLKLMEWNVHLFDLGAWAKDETAKTKIIDLIKKENPDVLCMEEFYRNTKHGNRPYTDIIRGLGYPYVAFGKEFMGMERTITIHAPKGATIDIGNVIFSKYPLSNVRVYQLGIRHYNMLSADVAVDSIHKITLNVVHLTSVGFGEEDIHYINEVKEKGLDGQNGYQSRSLLKKLTSAFARRAVLANRIDSLKKEMNHPIIICGDFNDVPSSYVYEKVRGNLSDPFLKYGTGFGRTYRFIFPTLRIDHVFYDSRYLSVIGYGRRLVKFSDHYPVITNFRFKTSD